MQAKMEKQMRVLTGQCDNTGRMSIPSIFALFMDLATEHGSDIKLGIDDLAEKDLFWLTVKTKVQIRRRPELMTRITAETWPEAPGRISCNRYYTICQDGERIVTGKSEWAIIEKTGGKLRRLSEVYPGDIEHCPDVVCEDPYMRPSRDFSGCQVMGRYTVRSTDIDVGQHMNNVAYVKMLFGMFSCSQLEEYRIREAEIAFHIPCLEGEEITLCRRDVEGGMEIGMLNPEGKTAAIARLLLEA